MREKITMTIITIVLVVWAIVGYIKSREAESVHYIPAPIDSVLTCCGRISATNRLKYIISSRVAAPVETYYKECTLKKNLFYRIREHPDGTCNIAVICKLGGTEIRLSEEIASE